ncbi:hypothetical protein [Mycobacterium sp.]
MRRARLCATFCYFVLLFRRNSVTGAVEVVSRYAQGIALNADLHAN